MSQATFKGPAQHHLRLELAWLGKHLKIRLREMQALGLVPPPEDLRPGTVIYPQEVEARLQLDGREARNLQDPHLEVARREREELRQEREEFVGESVNQDELPLLFLKRRFELSEADYSLFLLVIAPSFDPDFPRLYGYIQNHFERQYPTLSLYLEVFSTFERSGASSRHLIDLDAPLIKGGLITRYLLRPHLPDLYQPLQPSRRLLSFIEGDSSISPELLPLSDMLTELDSAAPFIIPEEEEEAWKHLMLWPRLCEHGEAPPVILLRGAEGAGKRRRAFELARRGGRALFSVDLSRIKSRWRSLDEGLRVAVREARLLDAALCLRSWNSLVLPENLPLYDPTAHTQFARALADASSALDDLLMDYKGLLILSSTVSDVLPPHLKSRTVLTHDLKLPHHSMMLDLWKHALPEEERAPDVDLDQMSASFVLTPGQIEEAVHATRQQFQLSEALISQRDLKVTVQAHMQHRLGDQTTLVTKKYDWEDLIVSPEVELQMRELISRYRCRSRVLGEWGLGRRFGHRLGLSALFEGPPGTGKTMSASLIANELDLDLYRIDLSRVMSRYVGETEKNLGKIFDEAERAQAMILFDEADSLFGSRTEVKSSNDRYANLEVNYLLQRIETFTGVAILTTNFSASIDDAFARRLSMRISFGMPEANERSRLWESMLKEELLPTSDVDPIELGSDFKLAGGHIRNAILRAAFIAASRDTIIDHELLYLAARIELKEQGMLVHGNPLTELLEADSARRK